MAIAKLAINGTVVFGKIQLLFNAKNTINQFVHFWKKYPHLAQKDFPLLNLDFAFLAYQQLQFEKSFRYSRLAIKNLKNKPLELAKAYQSLAKRYLEIGNDSMAGIE